MGTRQSSTAPSEPVVLTRHNSDVIRRPLPVDRVEFGYTPRTDPLDTGSRNETRRASEHLYPSPPPRYNDLEFTPRTYNQQTRSLRSRPLPPLPHHSSSQQREDPQNHIRDIETFLFELGLASPTSPPPPLPPRAPPPLYRTLHSSTSFDREVEGRTDRRRRYRTNELHSENPLLLLRELTRRKCPHCSLDIPVREFQNHTSSCNKRPPSIQYNEDTVTVDNSGECAICLEDLIKGDEIARLPCLCVYHIKCIEEWFRVKEICPQHPDLKLLTT